MPPLASTCRISSSAQSLNDPPPQPPPEPSGWRPMKSRQTTKASKLELRELAGLQQLTCRNNTCSCAYSNGAFSPRKTLATMVPPGRRRAVVMRRADSRSCDWMYSSRSCMPVTSGAPSHSTMSARLPSKWERMADAVEGLVMSPCSVTTPSNGAISCRSTETIRGGPCSSSSPLAAASECRFTNLSRQTCDQLPGAAQRSTTRRVAGVKRSKWSSSCSSL
mmetsp:Transcript_14194/g.40817  ORF Transcript_14194/g.40817 Transcript_14194/m.40817 type:complete len:221 (-) Transcript_14194:151-813(-)